MFEIGDKVIYIGHDEKIVDRFSNNEVIKDKIYEIVFIDDSYKQENISFDKFVSVFSSKLFILLSEYRKKKIKKICSKLEIK
jgi:hypothetical protein